MIFPECPSDRDDCLFEEIGRQTTLAYYAPIYDRAGNNTNPDRNVTSYRLYCHTCGRRWNASRCGSDAPTFGLVQYGKVISEE